jgi:hypothetical protein
MLESYLGLIPGEAPIDRLVDGVLPDPADRVIGDPVTGAIIAVIPPPGLAGLPHEAPGGLWRRLRTRWIAAAPALG